MHRTGFSYHRDQSGAPRRTLFGNPGAGMTRAR